MLSHASLIFSRQLSWRTATPLQSCSSLEEGGRGKWWEGTNISPSTTPPYGQHSLFIVVSTRSVGECVGFIVYHHNFFQSLRNENCQISKRKMFFYNWCLEAEENYSISENITTNSFVFITDYLRLLRRKVMRKQYLCCRKWGAHKSRWAAQLGCTWKEIPSADR